ncbi:hypothetical protein H6768_00625 [Candidatus Peribacteria bacterium]|nr:hypothetical protein [Candidatus Peribacteria bacterium]
MELRINAIRDLQEKNIFLSAPESVIAKLNDVEIFNTFGALFLQRVKVYLHQQPIFHHLKEQLLPLEVWYDSQLAEAARIGAPKKKLIKYDKSFWSDKELTVAKFFIENSAISAMNPKEFIEYIDRFLCHGNNEYFDLLVSSI